MKIKTLPVVVCMTILFNLSIIMSGCSGAGSNTSTPGISHDSQGVNPVAFETPAGETLSVIFLGEATDPQSGQLVQGYAFVHHGNGAGRTGEAKGGIPGKPGGDPEPEDSSCYGFLSRGAKWRSVENWVVNTSNDDGLPSQSVYDVLDSAVAKWEDAADGVVGDGVGIDILGNGTITQATLVADETSPDGVNEVYFGALGSNTIGVTIIWGSFLGPPKNRELVEWDQVYNQAVYTWSLTGEADKMDFDNIATHEMGHSFGMDDLYTSDCIDQTMYGYADFGETQKRSLEAGDIAGISELY